MIIPHIQHKTITCYKIWNIFLYIIIIIIIIIIIDVNIYLLNIKFKVASFDGHTGNVTAIAYQSAGRWIVTGSEDGTIKIWDVR